MKKEYFDNITAAHPKRQNKVLKDTILCDGNCGKSFLKKDLEKTAYTEWLCQKCMFTFLAEQEDYIETNKGDQHDV